MSLFVLVIRLNSLKNFAVIAFVKLRIDRQHLNSDIAEHKKFYVDVWGRPLCRVRGCTSEE